MRTNILKGAALASAIAGLLCLMLPAASLAASAPLNATVAITDSGFSPNSVTIAAGGTVTWTNTGDNVHSATQSPGSSFGMDSGGLGNGQTFSFTFPTEGSFAYTSATDCLNNNSNPSFNCSGATVNVVAPGAPATAPASPATAPTAPAAAPAAASAVLQNASVTISDSTISPANVTVTVGGSVTWTNQGQNIHTATTLSGGPTAFDTGGLGNGQSASVSFTVPGTYPYSSATDCLNGNTNLAFACSTTDTVRVVNAPPGPGAPAAPAPAASVAPVPAAPVASSPAPSVAPAPAPATSLTVTIDDTNGFTPNNLSIQAGQTVTWVNKGENVHSVVANSGVNPAFDSGGLGNGQSFSFQFPTTGSYSYHSSTEQVYTTDSSGNTIVTYQFNGTITVQ